MNNQTPGTHENPTTTTAPTATVTPCPAGAARAANSSAARKGRGESQPYLHGKGWAIRRSYQGQKLFLSGFASAAAAKKALRARMQDIDDNVRSAGYGATRTTLAQALQDYAVERLPFLKGAEQDARRINTYLRAAGLRLLKVTKLTAEQAQDANLADKRGKGAVCTVELTKHTTTRAIPNGLHDHRSKLASANAKTDKLRAELAKTCMADMTRLQLQTLVDQMQREHASASTIALERAVLRQLFNHAFVQWRWTELQDNPATRLSMPTVDNTRSRVLKQNEQELLDEALKDCRNKFVAPTLALLRETGMRTSEPLDQARWADVDWQRCVLTLRDAKTGRLEVPLSPQAIQALKELKALQATESAQAQDEAESEADERIVRITYNSLAAAWRRALQRAGITDMHLHDLRHTAATRMALKSGNVFIVQALTGHKTMEMLKRYVNVNADDVVKVMRQDERAEQAAQTPAAVAVAAEQRTAAAHGNDNANAPQVAADAGNVVMFPKRLSA